MANQVDNLFVSGTLTAKNFTPPAASIGNAAIKDGDPIGGLKTQHGIHQVFAQDSGSAATAVTRVIHVARSAGQILAFSAGCVSPCTGDATITVDLQVNGASVLTAAISLDSTQSARATVAALIATAAYSAGDILEIDVTVAAGTGALGSGLFASLVAIEDPQ